MGAYGHCILQCTQAAYRATLLPRFVGAEFCCPQGTSLDSEVLKIKYLNDSPRAPRSVRHTAIRVGVGLITSQGISLSLAVLSRQDSRSPHRPSKRWNIPWQTFTLSCWWHTWTLNLSEMFHMSKSHMKNCMDMHGHAWTLFEKRWKIGVPRPLSEKETG